MQQTHCAPRRKAYRRNVRRPMLRSTVPASNIQKTETGYQLDMAVPGFSKKEIAISVDDLVLTIKSNKTAKTDHADFRIREFDYNQFERSFTLSKEMDLENISAAFNQGILSITIPNLPEVPAKQITIK